jgi:hypothetical protein
MSLKSYLIMVCLILINAALVGVHFHLYLLNGELINMVCGFISVAVAILLTIQFGKEA